MLRRSSIFTKRRMLIFILLIIELFLLIPKTEKSIEIHYKKPQIYTQPFICSRNIKYSFNDNVASISTSSITKSDLQNFIFETKYLKQTLILDYKSYENITESSNTINFNLNFPFISTYSGKFHCINYSSINQNIRKPQASIEIYNSSQSLYFEKKDFTKTNNSEMKCYNKKFDNRYCEAINIYYKSRHFVFTTAAYYEFPPNFVLLSPRNTTDHQSDRLSYTPIVTNRNLEYDERFDSVTYVLSFYSDFYNMMKSHYEFLFPIYTTISNIEKSVSTSFDRQFLLFHENPYLNQLFTVFSDKKPLIADSARDILFLKKVVFGMERFWNQVESEPFIYNVPFEKLNGLKELALNRLGINISNSSKLTLFTIVEHHFENFNNYRQFYEQLKKDCPSSQIMWADLVKTDIKTAIKFATQASAIVGQNSNALIAGFWLKPNSYLVELIPNKFDCDNWYQDVAKYSQVNYIRSADKSDNSFYAKTAEQKEKLPKCYSKPDRCNDPDCYHRLKHQLFIYYADEWNDIWNEVCNNLI